MARGCGNRKAGGVYIESKLCAEGAPFYTAIVDPPVIVPEELISRISAVGMTMWERNGVNHLVDVVGECHYPNPADFVEESRRMGLSRRISNKFPLDKLTPGQSRIILVHNKAYINNWRELYEGRTTQDLPQCPTHNAAHDLSVDRNKAMCARCWYMDHEAPAGSMQVRHMVETPSVTYRAHYRTSGVESSYTPAIFMSWPITNIAVITGPESHETANKVRSLTSLLVEEVNG